MIIILTIFLISITLNSFLFVPYIHLLYLLKFQRQKQQTKDAFDNPTPIFDKFHQVKAGVPVGGGLLIITTTSLLFPFFVSLLPFFYVTTTALYTLKDEVFILLFTFISFGILGLFDDLKKTFTGIKGSFFGLRLRHKLIIEIILSAIISVWLFSTFKIEILHIPFIGVFDLGYFYIPFAIFTIVAFSNAYNITDGLDGLAAGINAIALFAFLIISSAILDTPLSIFIALWLGAIIAFLYFNIYPARIMLGDVGSLSSGATLAVIGLMLGKTFTLVIIGGMFIIEVASSLIQLLGKRYLKKKVFPVAPLHLYLQNKGWPEPKIVMRFWILSVVFAVFGLWLAVVTSF